MIEIRYPPEPEEGQSRVEWERELLNPWRNEMKRELLAERGRACERCGKPAWDLDEGIVPRSSMRGLPLEKRRIAFAEYGLFLLCGKCNREEANKPEWAFGKACERYGEDEVRAWYASIGFKAPEQRFMPKRLTKCTE